MGGYSGQCLGVDIAALSQHRQPPEPDRLRVSPLALVFASAGGGHQVPMRRLDRKLIRLQPAQVQQRPPSSVRTAKLRRSA